MMMLTDSQTKELAEKRERRRRKRVEQSKKRQQTYRDKHKDDLIAARQVAFSLMKLRRDRLPRGWNYPSEAEVRAYLIRAFDWLADALTNFLTNTETSILIRKLQDPKWNEKRKPSWRKEPTHTFGLEREKVEDILKSIDASLAESDGSGKKMSAEGSEKRKPKFIRRLRRKEG